MIQDISPSIFYNEYEERQVTNRDSILCYKNGSIYMNANKDTLEFPTGEHLLAIDPNKANYKYLFRIDQMNFFLYSKQQLPEQDGFTYIHWNTYRDYPVTNSTILAASVGAQLGRWYEEHAFCGKCAHPIEPSKTERALHCPHCDLTIYPTISPSVIVGITNKDKLLLTKYAYGPYKKYSLVAGYSEIGESMEQTVRREVFEEVSLHVKNIRYYKSQPWPASGAMLMGYFCEVDGSDTVTLQEEELKEGTWFSREELPATQSTLSLTNEMIEYFRNHKEEFD